MRPVDRLQFGTLPDGRIAFHAWAGTADLGVLTQIVPSADTLVQLRESGTLEICVSAGGPTRLRIEPRAFVHRQWVRVEPVGATAKPVRKADARFHGPVSSWPLISDTLIRFVESVVGDAHAEMPAPASQQLFTMAEAIWNAVVLADYCGQPEYLEQAFEALRRGPPEVRLIPEMLVKQKRELFGGDPYVRLLAEEPIGDGEPDE